MYIKKMFKMGFEATDNKVAEVLVHKQLLSSGLMHWIPRRISQSKTGLIPDST